MLDVDGIVGESYSTHTEQGYRQRQQSRPHASVCVSVGPGIYVIYGVSTVSTVANIHRLCQPME